MGRAAFDRGWPWTRHPYAALLHRRAFESALLSQMRRSVFREFYQVVGLVRGTQVSLAACEISELDFCIRRVGLLTLLNFSPLGMAPAGLAFRAGGCLVDKVSQTLSSGFAFHWIVTGFAGCRKLRFRFLKGASPNVQTNVHHLLLSCWVQPPPCILKGYACETA